MAETSTRKSDRPQKRTSYVEDDMRFDYDIETDVSNYFGGKKQTKTKSKSSPRKHVELHSTTDESKDFASFSPNDDESNHTVDYYTNGGKNAAESDSSQQCTPPPGSKSKKKMNVMPRSGGYTCDICDKVCVDSASYKRHMKGHSSDRSFQCEICSKAFIDACGLKRHMKIHVDDRPFACDLCFKSFMDRPSLTRHQQTHMDRPRMFSCQTCGKAFTDKHGLTRHERTHTGLRPFECGVCGKTFSESGSFKRHEKIHTGIRKFSCIVCGKRFLEKQSLLRHQRIVCGVTEDTTKNGSPLSLGRAEHPMASSNLNSSSSNGSGENGNLLNSNTSSLMSQETNSVSSVESNPPSNNHSGGRRRGRAPKKAPGKPQEGPSLQSLMQKDPNLYAGISDLVESIDSYEQMLGLCGDSGHSQIDAALTREPEPMPDNLLCFECGEHLVDGENFRKEGKTFRLPLKNQFKCLNCEDDEVGADCVEPSAITDEKPSAEEEGTGQGPGNSQNSPHFPYDEPSTSRAEFAEDNNGEPDQSNVLGHTTRRDGTSAPASEAANVVPGTGESLEHFRERLQAQHGVYFLGEMYPHLLHSMPAPQDDTDSTTATSTNASVSRSSSTEDADTIGQEFEPTVTFQDADVLSADAHKNPPSSKRKGHARGKITPDGSLKHNPDGSSFVEGEAESLDSAHSAPKPVYTADEPDIPSAFPCHLCTKVFATSAFLARHLYLHKNSPHKCMICGKTFTNSVSLRRHITTHTGEKPYTCPMCNKRFRDPSNFSKHKKICTSSPSAASSDAPNPEVPEAFPSPVTPKRKRAGKLKRSVEPSDAVNQPNLALQGGPSEGPVLFQALNGNPPPDSSEVPITGEPGFFQPKDGEELDEPVGSAISPVGSGFDMEDEDVDLPVSFGEPSQQAGAMNSMTLDAAASDGEDDYDDSMMVSEGDNSGYFNSLSEIPQNENRDVEMPVHCGVCERSFLKEKDLHRHMRFHSAENPDLTCEECGKSFNDSSSLKRHTRIHADVRPHTCEFCHRGYCDNWSLRKHQSKGCLLSELQVPASFMVPCPQCNRVFATTEMQAEHEAAIHKGELRFECDICLKRFSEAFNLKRHRRLHMAVCTGCDREFKDVKLLAEHQRTECLATAGGGDSGLVVTKEDSFPCPECGREYTTRANLERHKKFHSSLKPHVCELCPKRFTEAFKLKRHMKVHSETKPHVCSNCNKGFSNAQGLRQHLHKTRCLKKPAPATPLSPPGVVAVHPQSGLEPAPPSTPVQSPLPISGSSASGFPCQVCGKAFQKKFLLVRHMNVHSVDRPYICGQCGKAYKDTSSLKRHCLVHRGVKDCVCPDCGKAFFYSDSLKRHRSGLCGRTRPDGHPPPVPSKTRAGRKTKRGKKQKLRFSVDALNNNNNDNSGPDTLSLDTSSAVDSQDGQNSEETARSKVSEQGRQSSSAAQTLPRCPIRLPLKHIPVGLWSCTQGSYCWRCSLNFPSNTELMEHLGVHRHRKRYIGRRSFLRWSRKCYLKSELKQDAGSVRVYSSSCVEEESPLKIKLKLLPKPEPELQSGTSESDPRNCDADPGADTLCDDGVDPGNTNSRPRRSISRARWSWLSQIQ